MSNNNVPHTSFGLDQQGRLVRIEAGASNTSAISRLSNLEETLRRLSSNLTNRPEEPTLDSTLGKHFLIIIRSYFYFVNYIIWEFIDDITRNSISDVTDQDLSSDMTDGASSPNQTTASIPQLSSDEEYV